jgi:hypothetical protein
MGQTGEAESPSPPPHSTSPSPEDADLGEASVPCLFVARPAAHGSLSLSPPAPAFSCWRRVSLPALRYPLTCWHLMFAAATPKTLRKIVSVIKR